MAKLVLEMPIISDLEMLELIGRVVGLNFVLSESVATEPAKELNIIYSRTYSIIISDSTWKFCVFILDEPMEKEGRIILVYDL